APPADAFLQGLRELGYVEGQNLVIAYRGAAGKDERLPDLAAVLVGLQVPVIVAVGPTATRAAQRATHMIPSVVDSDWCSGADELDPAFAAMSRAGADALMVLSDPALLDNLLGRIVALAATHRLPAMYNWKMYVEAGGLMSYGPSLPDSHRRAAT